MCGARFSLPTRQIYDKLDIHRYRYINNSNGLLILYEQLPRKSDTFTQIIKNIMELR